MERKETWKYLLMIPDLRVCSRVVFNVVLTTEGKTGKKWYKWKTSLGTRDIWKFSNWFFYLSTSIEIIPWNYTTMIEEKLEEQTHEGRGKKKTDLHQLYSFFRSWPKCSPYCIAQVSCVECKPPLPVMNNASTKTLPTLFFRHRNVPQNVALPFSTAITCSSSTSSFLPAIMRDGDRFHVRWCNCLQVCTLQYS